MDVHSGYFYTNCYYKAKSVEALKIRAQAYVLVGQLRISHPPTCDTHFAEHYHWMDDVGLFRDSVAAGIVVVAAPHCTFVDEIN